ncbi:unnamed protein product, partial [Prorocentrum cordatum]
MADHVLLSLGFCHPGAGCRLASVPAGRVAPVELVLIRARLGDFPVGLDPLEVTAVDLVPAAPSVLQANFLEVPLRDGIGAALLEPSDPRRCAALPLGHFDGALLSNVLRAMPRRRDQRLAIARAARTLRVGGVLVIADLTKFRSLLSPRALRSWGLSQT